MSKTINRNISDIITVLVAFAVCLAVTGLFYKLYTPLFQSDYENRIVSARSALVGGGELKRLEDVTLVDGVSELYATPDGTLLINSGAWGFESEVRLNVVVSADGKVLNIAVVSHNESADKGALALTEAYLSGYSGLDTSEGVDAYTGATYTSEAIKSCVATALLQYRVVNGLEYSGSGVPSNDELINAALNETLGADYEQLDTELAEKVTGVYSSPLGYACLVEGIGYDNDATDDVGPSPIILLVSFDVDGLVTEISVIEQRETPGYGANAFNEYYLNMYDGYADFTFKFAIPGADAQMIDSQSNATGTSQSVYYLVKAAVEQMKLLKAVG